jgi:membrane dipeptidase
MLVVVLASRHFMGPTQLYGWMAYHTNLIRHLTCVVTGVTSMRRMALVLILTGIVYASPTEGQASWPDPDPILLEQARAILREVPLIDGHNDLPEGILTSAGGDLERVNLAQRQDHLSADLPRLREGLVGGQFWAAFVPGETEFTGGGLAHGLRAVDMVLRMVDRYPDLELALTADDVERAFADGHIASLIGLEGGQAIENSLAALRMYHNLGVRYMTLTHFSTIAWADAATDAPTHQGLTEFGENVIREMNRLGMLVDLSHVSAESMRDALRVTRAPVIFSHSGARALNRHPRNVPDDVLGAMVENRGIVMVDFIAGYVSPTAPEWLGLTDEAATEFHFAAGQSPDEPGWNMRRRAVAEELRAELNDEEEIGRRLASWVERNPPPRGTVGDVADHIDHIRDIAGIDNIGIGSDYYDDGTSSMAVGLEDVSKFPILFAELLRRGYSEGDLKKIASGNLLRVMREAARVARELQNEGGAIPDENTGG